MPGKPLTMSRLLNFGWFSRCSRERTQYADPHVVIRQFLSHRKAQEIILERIIALPLWNPGLGKVERPESLSAGEDS